MAYMEIFGNCSQNNNEFLRYSVPAYNLSQTTENLSTQSFNITHSHTMSLAQQSLSMSASVNQTGKPPIPSPLSSPTNSFSTINSINNSNDATIKPPALPPKSSRHNSLSHRIISSPPSSPKPVESEQDRHTSAPPAMSDNIINNSMSPTLIKVSSPGGHSADRDGYEHLCDAISQLNLSPTSNSVTNSNNYTTTVLVNDDNDDQVVLRRNLPKEKVIIGF